MRPDTLFKADCKSIKCRKRLLLSQVKCIFALKESFFDRGKRKQNIVIRSFLNRYLILIKQKELFNFQLDRDCMMFRGMKSKTLGDSGRFGPRLEILVDV